VPGRSPDSRLLSRRRRAQVPEGVVARLLPLPLGPGIGLLQGLRPGQQVLLIQAAGALPLPVLVLVAPADAEAVPRPLLGLPLPDRDIDPPIVHLVFRQGSETCGIGFRVRRRPWCLILCLLCWLIHRWVPP